MKKKLLLSCFALLTTMAARADVRVNATNFPDANFRNWVLAQSYGSDRVLTDDEMAGVVVVDVSESNIQSLKGIEYFTALEALYCSGNQLTVLDMSKNSALEELDCSNNQLTSLNVSGCVALVDLSCFRNKLKDNGMEALVESLPTVSGGVMNVIYNENEQNEMSASQVATAKGKGWTPMYLDQNWNWTEYTVTITIDRNNFPDYNFRAWILSQEYGADGILSGEEIDSITSIELRAKGIQNFKGIELFKALKSLDISYNYLTATALNLSKNTALVEIACGSNNLSELNVSGCTALTKLDCYSNNLTVLDVTENTALTKLDCSSNKLTELNVSGCTALAEINCYTNQLTALNVSGCPALTKLDCSGNKLTSINVPQVNVLQELRCNNNQLTTLDVSQYTALTRLNCEENQLTSVNVSGCTALTKLRCQQNQLTTLDLSSLTSLKELDCSVNQLTALDVSGCPRIVEVFCYCNCIKGDAMTVFVEGLPDRRNYVEIKLRVIYNQNEQNEMTPGQIAAAKAKGWTPMCYGNDGIWSEYSITIVINEETFPDAKFRSWVLSQTYGADGKLTGEEIAGVKSINVSNKDIHSLQGIEFFVALEELDCSGNIPEGTLSWKFDLSQNTALKILKCTDACLRKLDVSKCTQLEQLTCPVNYMIELNVSGCVALKKLKCNKNELTTLDVSGCPALEELQCDENKLTALNISGCTAMKSINCRDNQLTSLNVTECTALNYLYCERNQLTEINASGCASLGQLRCEVNQLTVLNVTGCASMSQLTCYNNQLTELVTTGCSKLNYLGCYHNKIQGEAMDRLVQSLPYMYRSTTFYVIYDSDEQNVMTYEQVDAAKAKGWKAKYYNDGNWLEYEGDPDGIRVPHVETEDEAIYNLSGQQLQKMQRGINIVGGKKLLMK